MNLGRCLLYTSNCRADASQFRFCEEQDGFNPCQFAVNVCNGLFILEILYRTDTADNELCLLYTSMSMAVKMKMDNKSV